MSSCEGARAVSDRIGGSRPLLTAPEGTMYPLPQLPRLVMSTRTPGYPGVSAVVVSSTSNADTSTPQVQVTNW